MGGPYRFPTALEVLTAAPVVVTRDLPVVDAATRLAQAHVSNAPVVVSEQGTPLLCGFVTETDFMKCFAGGEVYRRPAMKVAEIMRHTPLSVRPETWLVELAAIFARHGYRHMPVVDDRVLLGVVSRQDVLRGLIAHYREWSAAGADFKHAPNFEHTDTPGYLVG